MNENKKSAAIERDRYNYDVMFLCICNCCSNVECNSNEEGRNGRNVLNLSYNFNLYIIYIYTKNSRLISDIYMSEN